MSVSVATEEEEEDHELRDLVTNVLEENGFLAKVKVSNKQQAAST